MYAAHRHYQRVRTIRRLLRENEEFRLDWEEYLLARKALRHFTALGDPQRGEEYRELYSELAQNIRGYFAPKRREE